MADFIILSLIAAAVFLSIRSYLKNRKTKGVCGSCPYSSSCSGGCDKVKKKKVWKRLLLYIYIYGAGKLK